LLGDLPSPSKNLPGQNSPMKAVPAPQLGLTAQTGNEGNATRDVADERIRRIQRFWRKKTLSGNLDASAPEKTAEKKETKLLLQLPIEEFKEADSLPTKGRSRPLRRLLSRSGKDTPMSRGMSKAAQKIQTMWRQKTNSRGTLDLEDGNDEAAPDLSPFFPPMLTPTHRSLYKPPVLQGSEFDEAAAAASAPAETGAAVFGSGTDGFWSGYQSWFGSKFAVKPGQPGLLETWWQDNKTRAIQSLLHNSAPMLKRTLGDIGDLLKENTTADPDMPGWMRAAVRNLVGSLWQDIETEIETGLKLYVVKKPTKPEKVWRRHDPGCAESRLRRCGLQARAFVLSHYLPHNRSIFGRLKDPVYLLMTATTMLPVFGIRIFFFSIILAMLLFPGAPDEYQLISFILTFKGTQFFTTGVILGFLGAMQYYMCYLFAGDGELRECVNTHGPGASDWLATMLFDTFGSVVLVWIAFLGLPQTRTHWHQNVSLHGSAPVEKEEVYCFFMTGIVRKGGRLRFLMRYDLICFISSFVILLPIYFASAFHAFSTIDSSSKMVHAKQTVFWCRILYSLLSLPFVIFVIPGLGRVLTHSVTTGYDSTGACLEFTFPDRQKREV